MRMDATGRGRSAHQRKCLQLWGDQELRHYIRSVVRRHYFIREDREDAESEAWERIQRCASNLPREQYHEEARRAIHAVYMRAWRRGRREREHNAVKSIPSRESLFEGGIG